MSRAIARSAKRRRAPCPARALALLPMLWLTGGCSWLLDFDAARISEEECEAGEPNDTREAASPLLEESSERAVDAAICRPDIDFYSLTVPPGQIVTIVEIFFEQDGSQGNLDLRLYDTDGVLVAFATDPDARKRIICPGSNCESLRPGDYVIEVREPIVSTTGNRYRIEARGQ